MFYSERVFISGWLVVKNDLRLNNFNLVWVNSEFQFNVWCFL